MTFDYLMEAFIIGVTNYLRKNFMAIAYDGTISGLKFFAAVIW